jgi:hypothetical protein
MQIPPSSNPPGTPCAENILTQRCLKWVDAAGLDPATWRIAETTWFRHPGRPGLLV